MQSAEVYRTDGRGFKSVRITLKDNGTEGGGREAFVPFDKEARGDKSDLPDLRVSQ